MKTLFLKLAKAFQAWKVRRNYAKCAKQAASIIARTKAQFPFCEGAMNAWPTTGATGNGNAATGQYIANGTGTTLLWGTNNLANPTGWLTITKFSQKTLAELIKLENGDGLTAGTVQLIDGVQFDIEVRDDTTQVTSALTVGQRVSILDGGGLVPGGARGASYSAIVTDHGWDAAPKTPAGRMLTLQKFILIS